VILPGGVKRIQGTFTDENGTLYDPSAASIKIYSSAGVLIVTKTKADCTKVDLGIWYLDYPIPTAGPTGRWTVSWINTVATKDYAYPFAFIVWGLDWPTVAEVRAYLADMGARRLSDPTIEEQIYSAVLRVQVLATVGAEKVYNARLMLSVYLTYLAYSAEYERTAGQVPGPLLRQLGQYEALANNALIAAGAIFEAGVSGIVDLVQLRTNAIEDNT